MSDSADSPDDPGVVRGRKRERNIGEWRQNEAKNKRNRGEEYVSRATLRMYQEMTQFTLFMLKNDHVPSF